MNAELKKETTDNRVMKTGLEVYDEAGEVTNRLKGLSQIIRLLLDRFHLDQASLSEADKLDIVLGLDVLSDTLIFVLDIIECMDSDFDKISIWKTEAEK